jgi:phage FluMu protein Com
MQLRCRQCHRPFAITKEAVHNALELLEDENMNHYDAVCPHCRRTNQVSKQQLQRAAPGWRKKEATDVED